MPTFPTKTIRPAFDRLATRLQPWTDAEALKRFVRDHDEEAFSQLVRRYGPLVAGVCRRILGPRPEADDAVQATFWALARQASAIRDPRTLPAWLHAVAYRAARKAAATACPFPSASLTPVSQDDPLAEASWREVRRLLDEEIRRLPQRLRLPILLCYFEELTRDEAAERLGWSLSTVKRRLDLARERLRHRLARRGVEPRLLGAAGLVAGALTAPVAPALERACSHLLREPPSAAVRKLVTAPLAGVVRALSVVVLVGFGGVVALFGGQGPAAKPPVAPPQAAEAVVAEPLPPGALARFGTTRYRCNQPFWFGSFSKDGRWFVSGTDGVELWDLQTGLAKQLCPIRNNTVPRPAISPDGSTVAVLDGGPGIHLLDARTGKELRTVGADKPKFDDVRFTPDGTRVVATATRAGFDAIGFAVADGKEVFTSRLGGAIDSQFGVWNDRLVFFAVEPDPRLRPTIPLKLRVVDAETGKDLKAWNTGVIVSYPDGQRPPDGMQRPRRGNPAEGSPFGGAPFAVSAGAAHFAFLRADDQVGLITLTGGYTARAVELPAATAAGRPYRASRLWLAPDGKSLFVSDHSGLIARCDTATAKLLAVLPGHRNGIGQWHFDPDGGRMTTTGQDGQIRQWDLKTNKEVVPPAGYATDVRAVYSPDGTLAVVGDKTGAVDVYDAKTGKLRHALPRPAVTADWCTFELSPDGRPLAATRPEGAILWWDIVAGKERATTPIAGPKPDQVFTGIEKLAFTPDGKRLACGHPNGTLTLLDAATGKEVWRVGLPPEPAGVDYAKGLSVSPDGRHVARALRFWDRGGGRLGFALQVLDARTGEAVKTRVLFDGLYGKGPIPDVHQIADTPDGRYLVVLVRNGPVLLLDPGTLAEVARWPTEGRDGFALGVSPDGRTIVTGDDSGVARLWEVATGKLAGTIRGHRGHLATLAVSPDGRTLLTGGYDRVAYAWTLAPRPLAGSVNPIDCLRGENAEKARQAIWTLANDPAGPELARAAVKPARGPKPEAVAAWIADLDHPQFAKREAASAALIRAGRLAEPAVREALAGKPSAEARERLEKIVTALPKRPSMDEVFQTRAVQAMEMARTEAARQLLREWAAGLPGAWLTVEAKGALGRLGSRK
jgi:RNA polymerase sigma factor (sigma-70 family)